MATCPTEELSAAVTRDLTTQPLFPAVACTFSCMMKFTVKDCDPTTGETDDEGYEDEYVVRSWCQEIHFCVQGCTATPSRS